MGRIGLLCHGSNLHRFGIGSTLKNAKFKGDNILISTQVHSTQFDLSQFNLSYSTKRVDLSLFDLFHSTHFMQSTVHYNNRMLKQKLDKSVVKVNRYLKKENVKAVPFDKGAGFCWLTSEQYGERLTDILRGPQFLELPRQKEEPLKKSEKVLNAKLMTLYEEKISKELYESMRSVGAQPARLYGLAKVHKDGTPLRPILSLPGSCYQNLTRVLYSYCKDIDEGRIQTSSQKLKEELMRTGWAEIGRRNGIENQS